MTRDYTAEMDAFIEANWPKGDFVASVVAQDWAEELERTDSDLLAGFMQTYAVKAFIEIIALRDRRLRSTNRARASAREAGDALKRVQTGESSIADESIFEVRYVVDGENTRRRMADMTGPDHLFVANNYESTAKQAKLKSAFHRAIAKKVGGRRTSDVFTAEQVQAMYRSIADGPAMAA